MQINQNRRKLIIDLSNKHFKTFLKEKNQYSTQKQNIQEVKQFLQIKTINLQQNNGRITINQMKLPELERNALSQSKTLSHFSEKNYSCPKNKISSKQSLKTSNQKKISFIQIQKSINKFIQQLKFNQNVNFFKKVFSISQSCLFNAFRQFLQSINNDRKEQKQQQTNGQGIRGKSKTVNLQGLNCQAKVDFSKASNNIGKNRNTFMCPIMKDKQRKEKNKKLVLQSQVVKFSLHQLEAQQGKQQKKKMSDLQRKYLSIREDLLNNLKYFKLEIKDKKKVLKQMVENGDPQKQQKSAHSHKQDALSQKIQQKRLLLKKIEDEANCLAYYFVRKPMEAIEEEMTCLKQREKQMFQHLFSLQQSTPLSISDQIQNCVQIPLQQLKFSMIYISRYCPQQANDFKMNREQFQEFKVKTFSTFQHTIEKLSALVKQKNDKINRFLNHMDSYSVYNVAKMQRMEEYNKRMSIFQLKDHQFFKEILKVEQHHRNNNKKRTKYSIKCTPQF